MPPTLPAMDDCDRPACDDITKMMQQAAAARSSKSKRDRTQKAPVECPAGSATLGQSSWTLLHSMAAWYPDSPTPAEETSMRQFVSALARFYPCTWCAQDFSESIAKEPVRTANRTELCQWMCEQHNHVNRKTGKSTFPCDMATLDERWRKSKKAECQGAGLDH